MPLLRVGHSTAGANRVAARTPPLGHVLIITDTDPRSCCPLISDSLFPGGVGNTFGDKVAFEQLYAEVTTNMFDRPPDDTCYLGHGNDSTLGAELVPLPEGMARRW